MALTTPILDPDVGRRVEQQLTQGRPDTKGRVFLLVLVGALIFALLLLIVLLADVITGGWSVFEERLGAFLGGTLRSRAEDPDIGVFQGLRGTFWIAVSVIVLAFPVGIGAAIYLEEYANRTAFTSFIELNIRNLAGVPSVVYGILGLAMFVQALDFVTDGATVLAAGLTLAVLVLPIVIITSAEAIRAVPNELREAGYGVGATKWEVIRSHVLPYAAPGILTGTLLSLARAVGEAAPLILIGAITGRLASRAGLFDLSQLNESFTAMPIVIARWATLPDRDFIPLTAAAIVVLLVFVLLLNLVAILLRDRFERKRVGG